MGVKLDIRRMFSTGTEISDTPNRQGSGRSARVWGTIHEHRAFFRGDADGPRVRDFATGSSASRSGYPTSSFPRERHRPHPNLRSRDRFQLQLK